MLVARGQGLMAVSRPSRNAARTTGMPARGSSPPLHFAPYRTLLSSERMISFHCSGLCQWSHTFLISTCSLLPPPLATTYREEPVTPSSSTSFLFLSLIHISE